ncbi:zf-CCHC domain-containing protein [Tanacetum coccineum]
MDSDKYLEGQSMQRPPLFESDSFIYWKNRFETYVKSKDLDLWHVITNGDFQPIIQNLETKLDEVVPFEKQTDDLKRSSWKPQVYEMHHQERSELVNAKLERKSLALKARNNLVMKSVRFGSEDESTPCGQETSFKKFFKRRVRFVRQPQNDKKTFQRSQDDKKVKSERKCFRCRDPNHLIGECPKLPRDKNQRGFVGGSWSDSGEEDDEKIQDETCLVAQAPNEVCSKSSYLSDENSSIDDLALDTQYDKLCKMSLMIITKNKRLKAIKIV